ncbi:MAG: hypothetical protein AAGB46_05020, partial [Verrucomicrobiota bacterium]
AAGGSQDWVDRLKANRDALREVPWDVAYELRPEEREAISFSIAEFQHGESSEGRHLIETSQRHALKTGDARFHEATLLFIKEEQRHAAELGRYMDLRGSPLLGSTAIDGVFRWMRRLGGLEVSIRVLITAEIIAQTYYPALREATGDLVLMKICDQIIADEDMHIEFQTGRIASLQREAGRLRRWVSGFLQRFLFLGTVFVVWSRHRKVFKRGGFPFRRYWKDCWRNFEVAEGLMMRGAEISRLRVAPSVWD